MRGITPEGKPGVCYRSVVAFDVIGGGSAKRGANQKARFLGGRLTERLDVSADLAGRKHLGEQAIEGREICGLNTLGGNLYAVE